MAHAPFRSAQLRRARIRQIPADALTRGFFSRSKRGLPRATSESERNSVWWRRRELNPERRFLRTLENTEQSTESMVLFNFAFSLRCGKMQPNPFRMIEKDRKKFSLPENLSPATTACKADFLARAARFAPHS
ncbi:MAG: hypothetical protein ABSA45_11940 [Verrucomicrobiota bacterium]|jgi:hypothetical protein